MKNNKGFTLVELISVVAILTVVSTLAVLSVSRIDQIVKENQHQNLLNSFKIHAKKYVEDTGIKKVYVDTLIKGGYITSDKDDGGKQVIIDPVDSSKTLNCYFFDFSLDSNGIISEEPAIDSNDNDSCSNDIYKDTVLKIVYDDNKEFNDGWLKTNNNEIILKAISLNEDVLPQDLIPQKAIWTTPLAPDLYSEGETYHLDFSEVGYIEKTYNVSVRTSDGKDYTGMQVVRIDNSLPVVSNVRISDDNNWKNAKYIYADFEDKGSGLAKYIIVPEEEKNNINSLSDSRWTSIEGKTFILSNNNASNKVVNNGTYYIFVKDKADNVSLAKAIIVRKIDSTPPTCDHFGDNKVWKNQEIEITWTCTPEEDLENASPCKTNIKKSYSNMKDTKYTYTIKDEAGNTNTCTDEEASIFSDMEKPKVNSITVSSTNPNYKSINISYLVEGYDNLSGVDSICFTEKNDASYCNWMKPENGMISGSRQIASESEGSGNRHYFYGFVKDKVGNISNPEQTDYQIYEACIQTRPYLNGQWSACSNSCGGTQKRIRIDKWLPTTCSNSYDTQDCCNDVQIDYNSCSSLICTECSASCGEGICKNGYQTCYQKTSCSNNCGLTTVPSSNTGSCNAGPCCTVNNTWYRCQGTSYQYCDNCNGCSSTGKSCTYYGQSYCVEGQPITITYCDPDGWCYDENGRIYSSYDIYPLSYCETNNDPTPSQNDCIDLRYSGSGEKTAVYDKGYGYDYEGYVYGSECVRKISASGNVIKVSFDIDMRTRNSYWPAGQQYGYIYYTCADGNDGVCRPY